VGYCRRGAGGAGLQLLPAPPQADRADLDDFAHDFYSLAQKSAFRVLVHPAVHKAQAGFTQPVKEAS
jgi:outer membrane transport energization protein ExbB (TC 2.C.1.1.1)